MINSTNPPESILTPKFGFCNDVQINGYSMRKIIWLVPHVIKHKEGVEIITWRCNWGNVCKSGCIYAMSKKRIENTGFTQEKLQESDSTLRLEKI